MVGRPNSLCTEQMVMILPAPRGTMRLPAAWQQYQTPSRLVPSTSRQVSGGISTAGMRRMMPALATRISSWPQRFSISLKPASTAFGSVTSKAQAVVSMPKSRKRCCAVASFAGSRPLMMTRAPASASPRARPKPIPWLDPVTSAFFPVRSNILLIRVSPRHHVISGNAPRPKLVAALPHCVPRA